MTSSNSVEAKDAAWLRAMFADIASTTLTMQEALDELGKPIQVNVGWPRGNRGAVTHVMENTGPAYIIQIHTSEPKGIVCLKAIWQLISQELKLGDNALRVGLEAIDRELPTLILLRGDYPHVVPPKPAYKGSKLLRLECPLTGCEINANVSPKVINLGGLRCGVHTNTPMVVGQRRLHKR